MNGDAPSLAGPSRRAASGGPAQHLVVLLHGWGADGHDLISLAPYWAQRLPNADFVAPHGPEPCEAGIGRQWFGLMDRTPVSMRAGLDAVTPAVEAFVEAELARRGLGGEQLALVGFSQGTMLALNLALRRAPPPAAVIGFSGALLSSDAGQVASPPPVLLVHGADDEVVPAGAMDNARATLEGAGFVVEAHMRPGLGHGIDPEGIALASRFLERTLAGR